MNTDLRQKIIDELKIFLKRDPSEREIMNCQTDVNIMGRIRDKEQIEMKNKIDTQEIDIISLKTKI